MAKKSAKKPVKKVASKKAQAKGTEVPESEQFMVTAEGASDEEVLAALQHNIVLVHKHQEFLISSTMLDAKDSELMVVAAKIIVIDRKLMLMGTKINQLVVKLGEGKETTIPKSSLKGKKIKDADFVEL